MSAKGKRKSGKRVKAKKGGHKRNKDETTVRKGILTTVSEKASENKEAIKYVVLFIAFCFVFYLIYYLDLTVRGLMVMVQLRNVTAQILGSIFSLTGADVVVKGAMVSINGFGLEIIDECTAVFSSIVYCSCVLAYPTTLRKKVLGIAFGVPSLYAINVLRLIVLALVGIAYPAMFEFVHVYLWQASFIIFVVVVFLLWLRLVVK
ncbi:MAG: exosortase H [Halobacteriota archaeon]